MSMFRGINTVSLDSKGRMAVPTKYRDGLSSSESRMLVVTIDTESRCLLMYPMVEWEVIEAKIQSLPSFNAQARRIQRLLIGHATELEMDSHGRILLPPLLRDYAMLDKKLLLVGQGKKFEIWDEAQWIHGRESWLAEEANAEMALPEEIKHLSL